jgi:hypothetical protein
LTNRNHGRYIYGNRANEHMSVEELNALERYLEIWMFNIRSAKVTGGKPIINYRNRKFFGYH